MRKGMIANVPEPAASLNQDWLDLSSTASVELTSEHDSQPVEAALLPNDSRGWRAASTGTQTIRLVFDQPQVLRRILLVFEEARTKRTQEFALRWSGSGDHSYREILRQQWNFSPPDTVRETEDYSLELSNVRALELVIAPDISGGDAHASLLALRLA